MRRARRVATILLLAGLACGLPLVVLGAAPGRVQAWLVSSEPPPAPDYAEPAAWAARPERADKADVTPVPGTRDRQGEAEADVFFVHAGTNWTLHWNAPVDHPLVAFLVDGPLIEQWGSAFNGCCRVFAPRYRQELMHEAEPRAERFEEAVELAYADVRRAFHHYWEHENGGRPVVIAGAQSGGRHALRLLAEEVAGTPRRERLVAAYVVGARVDAEARRRLGDVPICDAPDRTGCLNTWNATGRDGRGRVESRRGEACVNPLSWRADEAHVPAERNLGEIQGRFWGSGAPAFDPSGVDAQCGEGRLWVTPPPGDDRWQPGGPGDYHIQNYMLFYANIRRNARERVGAFLAERG